MSYAVETKKRKFDRILEQLADYSTPTRASNNSQNNSPTVSLVASESESAKKRRLTSSPSWKPSTTAPTAPSLISHYLPSDRAAFLERLETFREITKWHIPSTEAINAAAWAKRGWTCIGTDLVSCGSCREQLLVQIDSEEESGGQVNDESSDAEENQYEAASELHDELVKKFQSLIVNGHSESCSWRRRGCDSSIQRIEGLLNMANAISTLHTRYNSILESDAEVPTPQSDQLSGIQEELGRFRFEENTDLNPN